MPQQNLRKSSAQCEVILEQPYERITIDYNSECCRATTQDAYIKAECFSPKGNRKFRVRIEIESVADDEVSRPQERIGYTDFGIMQYDPACMFCNRNERHNEHFYTTVDENYLSCQHIWTTTSDGKTICSRCKNIKLTRRVNADSSYQSK